MVTLSLLPPPHTHTHTHFCLYQLFATLHITTQFQFIMNTEDQQSGNEANTSTQQAFQTQEQQAEPVVWQQDVEADPDNGDWEDIAHEAQCPCCGDAYWKKL